jgi:hypothetical protein
MELRINTLRDACNFLVGVCDADVGTSVKEQYRITDTRWHELRTALIGQSAKDYDAGIDDLNRWCDLVQASISGSNELTHEDICEQINFLQVTLTFTSKKCK